MEWSFIHRDPNSYSSHPCVALLDDGSWLVAFSSSRRQRPVRHPPDYPLLWNMVTRSTDRGRSWSAPEVVPGYDWLGVETPGITQISTGEVLLNQWRFHWYPLQLAREIHDERGTECFVYDRMRRTWRPVVSASDWDDHPFPYVRADDGAYVHISHDRGRTFDATVAVDVAPYRGAFSPKGAVELSNRDLLLALGSHDHDPYGASLVVRSSDRGQTWGKPVEAARNEGRVFSEPALCETRSGKLLLMSREEITGFVYQSESHDGGETWGEATELPVWGYPSHCLSLQDGRLVVVYGYRKQPFGIRARISADDGSTWGDEIVIRDDLSGAHDGWNLGYPSVIEYEPGQLFVAYYGEDGKGVTCILGSYLAV
ncbi:MAG: sialidase family protein [Nitriliruptorales bacterium]